MRRLGWPGRFAALAGCGAFLTVVAVRPLYGPSRTWLTAERIVRSACSPPSPLQ